MTGLTVVRLVTLLVSCFLFASFSCIFSCLFWV